MKSAKLKFLSLGTVTFIIIGVVLIGINAGRHNNYSDEYLIACHAKGGVRVSLPKKGWDSYICLDGDAVVDMGDLESQFVVHPKKD